MGGSTPTGSWKKKLKIYSPPTPELPFAHVLAGMNTHPTAAIIACFTGLDHEGTYGAEALSS